MNPVPAGWFLTFLCILALSACDEQSAAQSAQPISDYKTARQVFWEQLYADGGETLYCGESFGAGYNKGINIEHVFPMSWVTRSLQCGQRKQCRNNSELFNRIEADLHNLYPSRSDINKARSSIAFGIIGGESRHFGDCDFEVRDKRPRVAEPRDEIRGDIARAMLYMAQTYKLKLFDRQKNLLQKWHRIDPPDQAEIARNNLIESIQGNRNPFIR